MVALTKDFGYSVKHPVEKRQEILRHVYQQSFEHSEIVIRDELVKTLEILANRHKQHRKEYEKDIRFVMSLTPDKEERKQSSHRVQKTITENVVSDKKSPKLVSYHGSPQAFIHPSLLAKIEHVEPRKQTPPLDTVFVDNRPITSIKKLSKSRSEAHFKLSPLQTRGQRIQNGTESHIPKSLWSSHFVPLSPSSKTEIKEEIQDLKEELHEMAQENERKSKSSSSSKKMQSIKEAIQEEEKQLLSLKKSRSHKSSSSSKKNKDTELIRELKEMQEEKGLRKHSHNSRISPIRLASPNIRRSASQIDRLEEAEEKKEEVVKSHSHSKSSPSKKKARGRGRTKKVVVVSPLKKPKGKGRGKVAAPKEVRKSQRIKNQKK